jgi:hypothetical protein
MSVPRSRIIPIKCAYNLPLDSSYCTFPHFSKSKYTLYRTFTPYNLIDNVVPYEYSNHTQRCDVSGKNHITGNRSLGIPLQSSRQEKASEIEFLEAQSSDVERQTFPSQGKRYSTWE